MPLYKAVKEGHPDLIGAAECIATALGWDASEVIAASHLNETVKGYKITYYGIA